MAVTFRTLKKSPYVWIGLLAALGTVYFLFDPLESRWMPKCVFHVVTGWDCPGCGSQRAIHALLHGDIAGAFQANAILFLLVPFLLLVAFVELLGNPAGKLYQRLHHPVLIILIAVIILLWGIARNLPFSPFT